MTTPRTYSNPLFVDPREGSGDLLQPLKDLHLPAESIQLEYADVAWEGNGPRGKSMIGIERKRLKDALNSMRTGRFAGHQLPGLVSNFDWVYLIVEGVWREDPDSGLLQEARRGGWVDVTVGQSRFKADELENWLTSIETKYGLRVKRVDNFAQMVLTTARLYKWWQKPWDAHRSGKVIYQPPPSSVTTYKIPLVQRMANCLDGVGWEKSAAVASRFKTPVDMIASTEKDWELIPGIGKVLSRRIVKALCGEKEDEQ